MRDCTFTPDLSKSAMSFSLHRSMGAASVDDEGSQEGLRGSPAGTMRRSWEEAHMGRSASQRIVLRREPEHQPRTNDVGPNMLRARMYTCQNVFSRLSQPQLHPEEPTAEASEQASCSSGGGRRSARGGASDASHSDEAVLRFLQRQNEHEEERCRRIQEIEACTAPALRPVLDPLSRRLVERRRSRGSRERCGYTSAASLSPGRSSPAGAGGRSRNCSHGLAEAASAVDINLQASGCSFRPKIRPTSARRPARGCVELSSGDLERRQARAAQLREQLEEEEMQLAPFTPSLNEASLHVRGRLRVTEEPGLYMAHLKERSCAVEAERERELRRRDEKALSECTFRPKVNEGGAPVYVRRLAESHRAAKGLREKENQVQLGADSAKPRPDWRS